MKPLGYYSFQQIFLLLVTSNSLAYSSENLQRRFPQAIIIGVKKAGTRALLEFLRLNPLIKAPGPEVHFFDRNFNKGLHWYRSQMPLSNIKDVILEKTPAYFISKTAPERIYQFNKNLKLIVVLRNPVTRAISDYTQALSKRRMKYIMPSFEDMVKGNGTYNPSVRKNGVNTSWGAIRIGIYHRFIKRWLQYFPIKQFHFVDGERLITNPAAVIRSTERFLGLLPTVEAKHFVKDPVKGFPCVLRPDKSMHCLGKTKGRRHPQVQTNVIQKLEKFYEGENEKLYKMINKRFPW